MLDLLSTISPNGIFSRFSPDFHFLRFIVENKIFSDLLWRKQVSVSQTAGNFNRPPVFSSPRSLGIGHELQESVKWSFLTQAKTNKNLMNFFSPELFWMLDLQSRISWDF